jgi:anti-sigma28 factor (negative regulator of flagellin synthesis)
MFNEPKMPEEEITSAEIEETAGEESVKDENAAETERELTPEEKQETIKDTINKKIAAIRTKIENADLSVEAMKTKLSMLDQFAGKALDLVGAFVDQHPTISSAALCAASSLYVYQNWEALSVQADPSLVFVFSNQIALLGATLSGILTLFDVTNRKEISARRERDRHWKSKNRQNF